LKSFVVDACVAAKWFATEENSDSALKLLDMEHSLHVPEYFFLEMDNIFWKWLRRGLVNEKESGQLRTTLSKILLKAHPSHLIRESAFEIACKTGLTVYDSLYVALAVRLDCALVTADVQLHRIITDSPLHDHCTWIDEL
jgi:predicted nucleic acid-binding protein